MVLIHDPRRHIGKLVRIDFGAAAPRTITVRLEPCATVKGRAVDSDGVPLGGVRLEAIPLPVPNGSIWLQSDPSGTDGRFRFEGLLAARSTKST